MSATPAAQIRPVVASREQWLAARKALLAREKALTRLCDEVTRERQALPWVRIEKEYVFDAPEGPVTLAGLFAGRSQLFIKHYMMAPGQTTPCVGCALEADHVDPLLVHLEHHDLSYVAIARAPIGEIEAMRRRMGWRFRWVSSFRSDFNYDFNVSFRPEELAARRGFYNYAYVDPGLEDWSGDSVFFKDESGQIFHTYSTFGRGGEQFLGIYRFLDVTPRGRAEHGPNHSLTDWARPHDMYGRGGTVEPTGRFHEAGCGCGARHGQAQP